VQHQRHDHGPDGVEVRQGVQRNPPESVRGVVTLPASLPGVRDFVHYDRKNENGDEKDGFHGVLKLTPPYRLIPSCVGSSFIDS